jgi:hypothetical protein
MIWAFTKTVWTGFIESYYGVTGTVRIYGWGIPKTSGVIGQKIADDITPLYQTRLAWAFIGISSVLAITSTFLKGLRSQLLLGAAGAGTTAYALVAVFVVIQNRLAELGINLQGESYLGMGMGTVVRANLGTGFYVTLICGLVLILFSALQFLLIGKKPASTS